MAPPPPAAPAIEPEQHGHGPPPRRAPELGQDHRPRAVHEHSGFLVVVGNASSPPAPGALVLLCPIATPPVEILDDVCSSRGGRWQQRMVRRIAQFLPRPAGGTRAGAYRAI